jgi:hypothetical protein
MVSLFGSFFSGRHQDIDKAARDNLGKYGLDGGGCVAVTTFPSCN